MSQRPRTRRGLALWLSSTATPLFVLDHVRRIVFFNAGCEALTGWAASEVIGQVCDYVSHPDATQVESLTGLLCPPPEIWGGVEQCVPAFVLTRTGERASRLIRYFPLAGDEGRVERVLGTFSPFPQPQPGEVATRDHQLHAQLSALRADLKRRFDVSTLVGESSRFRRLLQQLKLASRHTGSVHLCGEPGAGKEHLARIIHFQGETRRRAFVPVDCQRLTRSEVVDAVKHVLREARDAEPSRLSPGTLYLQHVDHLPDTLQQLLLEEYAERLGTLPGGSLSEGSAESVEALERRVRLMSSSVAGLVQAVAQDRLSDEFSDLLTSQQISVPALRDCPDDLPLLAQHFLEALNRDQDQQIANFADDVWIAFRKYSWPGNLDELRSVIVEAREACDYHTIRLRDLPFRFRTGAAAQSVVPSKPFARVPLEQRLSALERDCIQEALVEAGQNKSLAAQMLGLTRARLYRRMQILGLAASGDAGQNSVH